MEQAHAKTQVHVLSALVRELLQIIPNATRQHRHAAILGQLHKQKIPLRIRAMPKISKLPKVTKSPHRQPLTISVARRHRSLQHRHLQQ